MSWLQLHVQTSLDYTERISYFLENAKALSVTWQARDEQVLFELALDSAPLWENVKITALFEANIHLHPIIAALYAEFTQEVIFDCQCEPLGDKLWERVWLDEFKPMRFGQRLWVSPTVFEPPDKTAVNISLDPGLAFGTGTHPSTALCLEWLDAQTLEAKTIVDYGCGSGILAIAALKCGAKKVWAIDHDRQAIEATRINAKQNHISAEKLDCLLPSELSLDEKVDIVMANILAQPLMELAKRFKGLIKKGGHCVLAGILIEQVAAVKQAYIHQKFMVKDVQYKESWARIVANLL